MTNTVADVYDANGNVIGTVSATTWTDPISGATYVVPVGYNPQDTINNFSSFTASLLSTPDANLTVAGAALGTLIQYAPGLQYDLQRSFDGTSYGGFVPAFTAIASFDYGLAVKASGLTLSDGLAAGGAVNWIESLNNPAVNTSGVDLNNPSNVQNITNGFDSDPAAASSSIMTASQAGLAGIASVAATTNGFLLTGTDGTTVGVCTVQSPTDTVDFNRANIKIDATSGGNTFDTGGALTGTFIGNNDALDLFANSNLSLLGTNNTVTGPNSSAIISLSGNTDSSIVVDSVGNTHVTVSPTSGSAVTVNDTDAGISANIGANSVSDNLANTQVVVDTLGDVAFVNGSNLSQYNNAGQLVATASANAAGGTDFNVLNPATGEPILSTSTNSDNQITSQTAASDITYNQLVSAVADTLAAQLISGVLIQNDLPASIAAQAFGAAVVQSALVPPETTLDFLQTFSESAFNIAGSIAGSEAGAEVANALGIPTEAGSIVGGTTANLVTQAIVKEIGNDFDLSLGDAIDVGSLYAGLGGAGGAAIGSALAGLILTPTMAGEVAGAVATAAELATSAELLEVLAVSNPITAIVTAFSLALGSDFIGSIIGDIFGGLFGGNSSVGPDATAVNEYNTGTHQFDKQFVGTDNGGSSDQVVAMSDAMDGVMMNVLSAIGGRITSSVSEMSLVWFGGNYYWDFGSHFPEALTYGSSDPNVAWQSATYLWLKSLTISGGDPYMEYMLQHSNATDLTGLLSDLNAAHDYGLYAGNPVAFNLGLALSGSAADLANWETEFARAQAMGLDQLTPGQLESLQLFGAIVTPTTLGNLSQIVGSGNDFFGDGLETTFSQNPTTGQWMATAFDSSGQIVETQGLTTANGGWASIPVGSTMVGSGAGFYAGDHATFLRSSSGQIGLYGFDTAGVLIEVQQFTLSSGLAFTLPTTDDVIGLAINFGGVGDHDLFTRDSSTGYLGIYEFDGNGKLVAGYEPTFLPGYPTYGGTPLPVDTGTTILGTATNFWGTGGIDLVERFATGQLAIYEFNSSQQFVAGIYLSNADGSAYNIDLNAQILGVSHNILGTGDDVIIQHGDGHVSVAEFNNSTSELVSEVNLGATPTTVLDTITASMLEISADNAFDMVSGASISIDDNVANTILIGQGNSIVVGDNDTVTLVGVSNNIALGDSDTLNINGGSGNTITGSDGIINVAAGIALTIDNGGDKIYAGAGSNITVEGNGQFGWADVVTMSNGTVTVGDDASLEVMGSGNTINAGNTDQVGIDSGNNNTVTLGDNGQAYVEASTGNVINVSGGLINADSGVNVTINAEGTGIGGAAGDTINIGGNGEYGWSDEIDMVSGTINVATDTSIEIVGGNNVITGVSDDQIGIDSGDHNNVTAGTGSDVWVDTGNDTVVNTSNSEVDLNTNIINTSIIGNDNDIETDTGNNLNVTGTDNYIDASHSTIYLNAGTTGTEIDGSNDTIHIRAGDTYTVNGSHNTIITDTVLSETDGSTINHFNGSNDLIDIGSLPYDSSITVTESLNGGHTSGTLTVADNGVTVDTLILTNITSIGTFNVRSDGSGGTLLVDPPDASTNPATPNAATPAHDGFKFADVMHEVFSQAPPSSPSVSSNGDQFIFHANNLTQTSLNNGAEASHTAHALIDNFTNTPAHEIAEIMDAAHALPTAPENSYLQALHAHDGFHLA